MSRPSVRLVLSVSTLALALALSLRLAAPWPVPSQTRIAALTTPSSVRAHERVALYLGVSDVKEGARAAVRLCSSASCPVDRVQPLTPGEVSWTWLANAELPAGDYLGEVFVQVPTPYGYRTVDASSWRVRVGP